MSTLLRRPAPLAGFIALIVVVAGGLYACKPAPAPEAPPRPVKVITAGSGGGGGASTELAGEVRARVESRLGFRVGGKIISRKVEAGQRVKRGAELARLDVRDYQLAVASASAEKAAAEADLANARSELKRFEDLHKQGFVSETELERKRVALALAEANLARAGSSSALEQNRFNDTALRADADGVVMSVEFDVGEVVTAGQPVVVVAQDGAREIAVEFPEDRRMVANVARAEVTLWAQPGAKYPAKLRELSAAADPVTRTFRARYSVQAPAGALALGQSASVILHLPATVKSTRLPTSALVSADGASQKVSPGASTLVWVLADGVVKRVPVQVASIDGNDVLVSGLADGMQVVVAGVHVLTDGQKARPLSAITR